MRIHFRTNTLPKRFVKAVQSVVPELKHSQAQELTARLFGYRDWHELSELAKNYAGEPTDVWALAPRPTDSFIPDSDPKDQPLPERFGPQVLALEEIAHQYILGRPSIETLRQIYQKAYGAKSLAGTLQPAGEDVENEIPENTEPVVILATPEEMVQGLGQPGVDPQPRGVPESEGYYWHLRLEDGAPALVTVDTEGGGRSWFLWTNDKDRAKIIDAVLSTVDADVYHWRGYRGRSSSPKFSAQSDYDYRPEVRAAWEKAAAILAPRNITFVIGHNPDPSAEYKFFVILHDHAASENQTVGAWDEDGLLSFFEAIVDEEARRKVG